MNGNYRFRYRYRPKCRFRYRYRYGASFGIGGLLADTEIAKILVSAEMSVSVSVWSLFRYRWPFGRYRNCRNFDIGRNVGFGIGMQPLSVSVSVAFKPIPKLPKFRYRQIFRFRSFTTRRTFSKSCLIENDSYMSFSRVLWLWYLFSDRKFFHQNVLFPIDAQL